MVAAIVLGVLLWFAIFPAIAKEKPKSYQTGRLLGLQVQNVNRGTVVMGSMATPLPGLLYVFQIQCDDLIYYATYSAGKLSC
jgi:hypothetical protein